MKIRRVHELRIPEIKVIEFERFEDKRGYFTELFNLRDLQANPITSFLKDVEIVQTNESFSRSGTVRGLHFQWNPHVGKLVRTISGHMIDLVLDIRRTSPDLGRIIAYDMPAHTNDDFDEWIWVPPGFAHGNVYLADTKIEYYCTGTYNPACESVISPFASDLDWSISDERLRSAFTKVASGTELITEKDKHGLRLGEWLDDLNSYKF